MKYNFVMMSHIWDTYSTEEFCYKTFLGKCLPAARSLKARGACDDLSVPDRSAKREHLCERPCGSYFNMEGLLEYFPELLRRTGQYFHL